MKHRAVGDLSGAVADLGILVPLGAALVVVNGLDPGPLLVGAGLLTLAAGIAFRIPFPVQPLKALTALAVAQELRPEVIHAAGLEIGLCLLVLSLSGLADRFARWFTKPVIRALQFGVGVLLVTSAARLVVAPPDVFQSLPPRIWLLALAGLSLVVVAFSVARQWHAAAFALLSLGLLVTWIAVRPVLGPIRFQLPGVSWPPLEAFGSALVLLVVPQLPLTFGNAVVGVSDLAHEHFANSAQRVTPRRVAASAGVGNILAGVIGGMPMCHGSSGLSAHVRLGATTHAMNLVLGGTLLLLGLVFSDQVLTIFGLLPVWVLAGFLAYAGLRHALLVLDLRGARLGVAVAAGLLGVAAGNLALTTAAALLVEHATLLTRRRGARASTGEREARPTRRH